ncbi:MAG: lipopolysaccharide biosynthesis protein [Pyrinomonadaceae bacterium]
MIRVKQALRRIKIGAEDSSIWRRFRWNVSISVLGSAFSLVIKLVQTALLTRLLKIDDYGRVLIVLNLFLFLDSFLALRVHDVMFRFFQPLEELGDDRSLKRLLRFCLGISLTSGLIICALVLIVSPWLADRLYPGLGLAPLFNIYGCTVLVSTFSGFYEPILRIHNRFTSIVVPQVLGSLVTLAILVAYFAVSDSYDLKVIIAAFAVGVFVQNVPPLAQALRMVKPLLVNRNTSSVSQTSELQRPELIRCLFNSNLSGYLKIGLNPGDLFLLGLFSSPMQVALYGLAKQLTAPLALLTTNMQTALIPEITSLVAKRKFEQLRRLLRRYVASATILSTLLVISAFLLARILLFRLFQPEYAAALPVFYVLISVVGIQLVYLVFRPLAVSLDLLKWHNLALLTSSSVVVILALAGGLNAFSMALLQLADVLIVRSLFNVLVWMRLKRLNEEGAREVLVTA